MPKVAVITAGAGGMGLAAAHAIAGDGAVLISDVNKERLDVAARELSDAGVRSSAVVCDVTDRRSVGQLVESADRLGTVTSVTHTAGASPSIGTPEMILRVNALGAILVDNAFYEIASQEMALVNVASVAGHQLPVFLP